MKQSNRDASQINPRKFTIQQPQPLIQPNMFGWDMTYAKVFDEAHAPLNETMRKYFRDSWLQAPYTQQWTLDPLFFSLPTSQSDAVVLIDVQAAWYFGFRSTELKISGEESSIGRTYSQKRGGFEEKRIERAYAKRLAKSLLSYVPVAIPPPKPYSNAMLKDQFVWAGYLGVVSVYNEGKSRQFPVSAGDFMDVDRRSDEPGPLSVILQAAEMPDDQREKFLAEQRQAQALRPMLVAAKSGDVEKIRTLVKRGIDPNAWAGNETALVVAAKSDQIMAVEELLRLGAVDPKRLLQNANAALWHAVSYGRLEVVRRLLKAGANPNANFALARTITAVSLDRMQIAEELVSAGATTKPIDETAMPIMLQVMQSPRADKELFDFFIAHGAPVQTEYNGKTPLLEVSNRLGLASVVDPEHLILALVTAGADINYATGSCRTAISWALQLNNNRIEELLAKHGADVTLAERCRNPQ